jgi:hypothetical protein
MLITLENRKKTDMNLILKTLQREPKSFTEILRATRLPRKTLNLRLKELIKSGAIIKDGGYHLNGDKESGIWRMKNMKRSRFVKENLHGKSGVIILASLLCFLTLPLFSMPLVSSKGNSFTVDVNISDAVDVFAWEVYVDFDPNVLYVIDVTAGDFLSSNTFVMNSTNARYSQDEELQFEGDCILCFNNRGEYGSVHIASTKLGILPGASGEGTLVTITFGIRKYTGALNPYIELSRLLKSDLSYAEGELSLEK